MRSLRWHAALAFLAAMSLASLAAAEAVQAQVLHIAAGPTLGTISSDDFPDSDSKVGFFIAAGTSFPVGEKVAISPYVGYVQKGAEFDDETASYDYIEIPVLISTWFPVGENLRWAIFAGPQIGFQINCDEGGFDCTEFDDHKGTEFGIMAGTGLQFPMGESGALGVSIGADIGLTDLYDSVDYKTRTYFLSAQYSILLGGGDDGM